MSIIASWFFWLFFLVTLPGTSARLLAVTWGKPVFGWFPILYWIGFFLGFFGLSSLAFCQLAGFCRFFGHPSFFGPFIFRHGFTVR